MIEDEIIKHIPEIASATKVVAAAVPFTAIVKRMLGPAADELAVMWRDQVRLYRYERQLKCVEKAEKMAIDAGFTPKAVPIKLLFPLLEGASLEENEDLHTMWSALLANAASPDNTEKVRPGFIAILRQMSPDEARLLELIYDQDLPWNSVAKFFLGSQGVEPEDVEGRRLGECLDGLEANQLIRLSLLAKESMLPFEILSWKVSPPYRKVSPPYKEDRQMDPMGLITYRGRSFVEACRPPKPKP